MSLNVPQKRLRKRLRIQKLIQGLRKGKLLADVALECGVSEKTIDRDMAEWKDNGGFDKWLLSEFLRLHQKELGKEDGGQSYHTVADLLKKRLKEQQEIIVEGTSFVVKILDNSKENPDDPV
jgi:Zn-dependent peptidase ImmA (M78 family)